MRTVMTDAVRSWAEDVVAGTFPDDEHAYH
ncbi:MAG: hypothetical protein MUC45_12465 [Actinomycetia bacterium]|nr:hypothetical protein [Actinomycetes bacterium]